MEDVDYLRRLRQLRVLKLAGNPVSNVFSDSYDRVCSLCGFWLDGDLQKLRPVSFE